MSGDTGDTINNNANIDLTVSANSGDLTGDTNITGSLGTNDTQIFLMLQMPQQHLILIMMCLKRLMLFLIHYQLHQLIQAHSLASEPVF